MTAYISGWLIINGCPQISVNAFEDSTKTAYTNWVVGAGQLTISIFLTVAKNLRVGVVCGIS